MDGYGYRHTVPRKPAPVVVSIDAGTTGVRSLAIDTAGAMVHVAYRELTQHFPRPGWVEHDPDEIWSAVQATLAEVTVRLAEEGRTVATIGITNQRETVVAWDRRSGRPLHRAIVWQDKRTASTCASLADAGYQPLVRERTGLVLDPYFSATKMRWLLTDGEVHTNADLCLSTVDSWILWNLTGGSGTNGDVSSGGVFATDVTNASRTMLFDIVVRRWSGELCDLFGVPEDALAEVRPSSGRFGSVARGVFASDSPLQGVPISGIAGDQHAALFGQCCFTSGMAKVTYGTGSFIVANAGPVCPEPIEGLLTTLAWDLGNAVGGAPVAYALEGSVFAAGAAIQWLRDGLGVIEQASELEPLARSVDSSNGVVIVPAFSGLGSPHWDPYARGTILGITRGTGRAELARAVVEAMAFQVRDVLDAMTAALESPLSVLRVDGGASVMDLLLELQADHTAVPVERPLSIETTVRGAAMLAGLAEGVWGSVEDLAALWTLDSRFEAGVHGAAPSATVQTSSEQWQRALERSRSWALDP